MITKERLEKLIEKGATIYFVGSKHWDGTGGYVVVDHKLTKTRVKDLGGVEEITSDTRFYETKEDAEFACKYHNIQRIDYLNLPTYKDFVEKYQTFGDVTIHDEKCVMFNNKTNIYSLYAADNEIWIGRDTDGISLFNEDLNKDNYIKACELCRKLFLGED